MREHIEDEETLQKIDDNIPPERIDVPTLIDLPDEVALRFAEKDGTRGRIMVVQQSDEFSTWDGRYLIRWAEALRTLRMSNGSRPPLAGRAPVFADMISAVYEDMPKAIGAAFFATVVLVLVSFRRRRLVLNDYNRRIHIALREREPSDELIWSRYGNQ